MEHDNNDARRHLATSRGVRRTQWVRIAVRGRLYEGTELSKKDGPLGKATDRVPASGDETACPTVKKEATQRVASAAHPRCCSRSSTSRARRPPHRHQTADAAVTTARRSAWSFAVRISARGTRLRAGACQSCRASCGGQSGASTSSRRVRRGTRPRTSASSVAKGAAAGRTSAWMSRRAAATHRAAPPPAASGPRSVSLSPRSSCTRGSIRRRRAACTSVRLLGSAAERPQRRRHLQAMRRGRLLHQQARCLRQERLRPKARMHLLRAARAAVRRHPARPATRTATRTRATAPRTRRHTRTSAATSRPRRRHRLCSSSSPTVVP